MRSLKSRLHVCRTEMLEIDLGCEPRFWNFFITMLKERNTFNVVGILSYRPKLSGFLPSH